MVSKKRDFFSFWKNQNFDIIVELW